jgi:hypothetical protein
LTAAPVSLATALNARLADDSERLCDYRQAVLRGFVDDALGPLAGRATCSPEELAEVMGWGRSTSYEACRDGGPVPSIRVGRRVVVSVVGLVALLLGVDTSGADLTGSNVMNADPESRRSSKPGDVTSDVSAE